MKYIKPCLTLFLLGLSVLTAKAQSHRTDLNKIVPPTPNVMALGKYGDNPVNMANGIPNIAIPLYEIKTAELQLPISVSYHAGGIKVDEESSFIGLGWALNAGGVITRVVKDRDDWGSYGFNSRYNSIPSLTNIDEPGGAEPGGIGNDSLLRVESMFDKEPDLYIMNVAGLTANFCLDNAGKYVSLDKEPLSITVNTTNKSITVIDKYGKLYRFGTSLTGVEAYESTSTDNSGASWNNVLTAFHLTEIISTDKSDTIRFEYKSLPYSFSGPSYAERYHIYDGSLPVTDRRNTIHEGVNYGSRNVSVPNTRIIDRIIFKYGYIQFTHVSDRQDVSSSSGLPLQNARIAGFNVFDNANQKYRSILFKNNDHFNRSAAGISILPNYTIPAIAKKSLKLNGIEFYGRGDFFDSDYKFEYDPTPLPPRNTTSQDVWGYNNGKSVADFIPLTFYTFRPNYPNQPMFVGSNREPDFSYMKAASLTKIIYPTGGSTIHEYEPHYYLTPEQQEGKTQLSKGHSVYAINKDASCPPEFMTGIGQTTIYEFTVNEDLGSTGEALLTFSAYFTDYLNYSGYPMVAKIKETTGNVDFTFEHIVADRFNTKNIQQTFVVKQGRKYRIELYTNNNTGSTNGQYNSPRVEAYVNYPYWDYVNKSLIEPKMAGGLRIKKTKTLDSIGTVLTQKVYEYGIEKYGASNIGIGKLISDPKSNFFYSYKLYAVTPCDESLKRNINFISESQVGLGMNYGCPVDYERVTVYEQNASNASLNGKSEYYYSRTGAVFEPMGSNRYPYTYLYFPTWAGSNLIKEIHYKTLTGSTYEPISSTEFEYSNAFEKRIKYLKIIEYQPDLYTIFWRTPLGGTSCTQPQYLLDNPQRYFYYNFYVSIDRNLKTAEIHTSFQNGISQKVDKKIFTYNPNYDLKSEKITNSKGIELETKYKYTGDLNYSNLIAANIISLPVLKESYNNNKVIAGEIFTYNDWGKPSEIFKVNTVTPLTATDYVDRIVIPSYYKRYNTMVYNASSKRISEVKAENSLTTVYIWSYKSQFPIAEITNASSSNVETVLGSVNISNMANKSPSIFDVNTFIAPLKSDYRFAESRFKAFSYDPLVGMTGSSDHNGQNAYYGYDFMGRLQTVKNNNGNVLSQNWYKHYNNPSTFQPNVSPDWKQTGIVRCKTDANGNTGYQEIEERDLNVSSTSFGQLRWITGAYNTTACPLPAPPCSFVYNGPYNSYTNGIYNNGGVVSFYMVYAPTFTMNTGSTYYVAAVNGGCRPTSTRTINYSSAGRTWIINIYSDGQMSWHLSSGSSVPAGTTIGTPTLTYNL